MTFNQQGQQVTTQYNAEGNINIGGQPKQEDIATLLETFKRQLAQASEKGILDADASTDVDYHVTKALHQAKKPYPDKKSVLDYLQAAQGILQGVARAGSLVPSIAQIVEMVRRSL